MEDRHFFVGSLQDHTNNCFTIDKGYFRMEMIECLSTSGNDRIVCAVGASKNFYVDEPQNDFPQQEGEEIDWLFAFAINESKMARIIANAFNKVADRLEENKCIQTLRPKKENVDD